METRLTRIVRNVRLTGAQLQTFLDEIIAVLPAGISANPGIKVEYGSKSGEFRTVADLASRSDLPDELNDFTARVYGHRPGGGIPYALTLRAGYPGAQINVESEDELWAHGVLAVFGDRLENLTVRPNPRKGVVQKAIALIQERWRPFLTGALFGSIVFVGYYRGTGAAFALLLLGLAAWWIIFLASAFTLLPGPLAGKLTLVMRANDAHSISPNYAQATLRWTKVGVVVAIVAIIIGIMLWRFPVHNDGGASTGVSRSSK